MNIDQIGTEDEVISCDICGIERPSEGESATECESCGREGLDCCVLPGCLCSDCEDEDQDNYEEEYEYDEDDENGYDEDDIDEEE